MRFKILIIFFLLSAWMSSCNTRECNANFDFTEKEKEIIPYQTDSLLIFRNEQGDVDTFFITTKAKGMVNKGFEIETSSGNWLEIEIRYTNEHFAENPNSDRQLAWITKDCKDQDFNISADWMDFYNGLYFKQGTTLENYSYPDTLKKFVFNRDTLTNVLKFQTNTAIWPDAIKRNVKTVYWLIGEGVIMYETRNNGIWKKLR